jgi:hypothetical protein
LNRELVSGCLDIAHHPMASVERPTASTAVREVTDLRDVLELTYEPLDSQAIIGSVQDDGAGALAVFIGTTRDTFEGTYQRQLSGDFECLLQYHLFFVQARW